MSLSPSIACMVALKKKNSLEIASKMLKEMSYMIESSITGCIETLFGGNSMRIFGALGDACFVSATAPLMAAGAATSG